jgi:hypothetical protein
MTILIPSDTRRKRETIKTENLAIHGGHVFIRRWAVDAQCRVSILEVLRHA